MGIVFKVENIETGDIYVSSTIRTPEERFRELISTAKHDAYQSKLFPAINEFDPDSTF